MVVPAASAAERLARAREWLLSRPPAADVLVVGPSLDAAHELLLGALDGTLRGTAFGWRRTTLGLIARDLSEVRLAEAGKVPVTGLGAEAVTARTVAELSGRGALGRYQPVADTPGFVRALAACLAELRLACLSEDDVRPVAPELADILTAYRDALEEAGLADRAETLTVAAHVAADASADHPLLDLPVLLFDVPVHWEAERRLVASVMARAPEALVTVPAGDARTTALLGVASADGKVAADAGTGGDLGAIQKTRASQNTRSSVTETSDTSLGRLQAYLFEDAVPRVSEGDETLTLFSAPGENRECVEIARRVLVRAGEGVPFDRMAVFLRAPGDYRAHLEEALGRAGVPLHFDRGVVRPDPAGRAFLALLRCLEEGYSARRFAEYLSLGEVPPPTPEGAPPEAEPEGERWVPAEEQGREPRSDVTAGEPRSDLTALRPPSDVAGPEPRRDHGSGAAAEGTLRAPRRWERLIVEASVIGGIDRWRRRLDGLAERFAVELEGVERELDGDGETGVASSAAPEAVAEGLRRRIQDLGHLRNFALPLLEALSDLPRRALWGDWLEALSALADRALRAPGRVQSLLSELAPLGPVGPVDLAEVIRVLSAHLLELRLPAEGRPHGKLFVGPAEAARGRSFQVVFVPGLADRLFPQKVAEEPVLLDEDRRAVESLLQARRSSSGPDLPRRLPTSEDRVAVEQLALRLAVGAAAERAVLSYPRLDLGQSRPRVPSFYALEALRASEGKLPLFDDLRERAEAVTEARVGWPAPPKPEAAIDAAEYDLAVLETMHGVGPAPGAARYLLDANPHLARALRHRAFRWQVRRWSAADGLVDPSEEAAAALRRYRPDARPFSATALHNYATCPYKFFLSAVHRLDPREVPEAIETLDPLQKGSLIHDIQFACLSDLREQGLLPVRPATLAEGLEVLDGAVDRVAAEYRERLVPAIDRVWEDGIDGIRTDLRRWLRDTAHDASGFVPWRFELAFGLPQRARQDPDSRAEPVELEVAGEKVAVRGAIDLVERRESDGALRITDHKTGRARVTEGAILDGGSAVQPVLYALAAERLFPDRQVVAGRLYYCTSDGGYRTHEVPLDDYAREAMARAVSLVRADIDRGFLPALPAERACQWCDYRPVCGPWEERRTARKETGQIRNLLELRGLR